MAITLTSNYRETLAPETLAIIERYEGENYDLGAMLVFIDEYGETTFQEEYEEYVRLGEEYGFDAVDAWLKHTNADHLDYFESAYLGEFLNPRDMAEDYFDGDGDVHRLDYRIVIDWTETANYLLGHEVDRLGDFYFRCTY